MEASEITPLLSARGITKAFGGTAVLENVDFDLRSGEVHTIMGENGAGKSTLLKILGGVHQPDSGEIHLDGVRITLPNPHAAQGAGVALIHQEPLTFPDLDVAENIFTAHGGGWPLFSLVNWRKRYAEAERLLRSLGVHLNPRARVAGLSIADQQMVELAGALSTRARILLMDEPTASLTPDEVRQLFKIVRNLRDQGTAIVFISHRLEEVFALSDRITVLRDGRFIATRERAKTSTEEVIRLMVGRPLSMLYERTRTKPGRPLLQLRGLTHSRRFSDINLEIRAGEIVGLAGLVGAGRTDVARALFGVAPAEAGTILIDGETVRISSPSDAIRLGLALVPEDRQQHGLLPPFSLAENISAASLPTLFPSSWIQPSREATVAEEYRASLRIASRDVRQPASELSGGNQQKVVLGKWLHTAPRILLLDEPTRGIDIGAKQEVHHLMNTLASEGKAILLISSDLPEILGMADRILVMREGKLAAEFPHAEATAENVMAAATGQNGGEGA
jgi:rhamnose transport system ATP-binding protein